MKLILNLSLGLLLIALLASPLAARTLTIEQARAMAIEFNRTYLAAQEEVVKADAEVTRARSEAFPTIMLNGTYNRSFKIPSFFFQVANDQGVLETAEFRTGFSNSFGANLSVVQSIWSGGKVFTALSIAKDYRKYSRAVESQVANAVTYEADVRYYGVSLHHAKLEVVRKSHQAFSHNLEMMQKQFAQGQVSEYDVLRARVEKSNLEPQLLKAESDLRLARKRLNSFLGLELDEPIELVEAPVETSLTSLPALPQLVSVALQNRPEMQQSEFNAEIMRKAIRIARSDYYPSLSAIAVYDWQAQADALTLRSNNSISWTAGLKLSIPIFRGGQTRGAVTKAVAEHNQANLAVAQNRDNIRLEVEEARDRLLQAGEALRVQATTIAQAEEGLRIANLRYETGIGTLLEVLSSQAALTKARELLAEATYTFRTAKAGLKMATTIDLDNL